MYIINDGKYSTVYKIVLMFNYIVLYLVRKTRVIPDDDLMKVKKKLKKTEFPTKTSHRHEKPVIANENPELSIKTHNCKQKPRIANKKQQSTFKI